jgi:UPF0716 protein FxsA
VALAFLVVPFVELFVLIQVGQVVGVWWTILLVLVISVLGSWLVRREGWAAWRRVTTRVQSGEVPGAELVDGGLILLAGALLLTPGFVTDLFALFLLLPPSRAVVRRVALKRLVEKATFVRQDPGWVGGGSNDPGTPGGTGVIDV